jgi:hypothetical protein
MPEPGGRGRRELVRGRAHGICEYCRSPENLAFACQGCNNHKYTKTDAIDPVSGEVMPLFHPRRDRWRDHFVWSHDFSRIIGLTAKGRATVETLRLNRPGLVNLRRALFLHGEHPLVEPESEG